MLRERCSCAISVHGILASFVFSSLFRPLTPLFPLDASHSPVSLIIPAHTQKQGGGGYPKEVKEMKEAKEVDYNRAFLTPAFTTTSINIVGEPTILERPASKGRALHRQMQPKSGPSRKPIRDTKSVPPSYGGQVEAAATRTFDLQLSTLNRPSQARETFCEGDAYHGAEARRGVCRAEVKVKGVHCADPAFPGSSVFPADH